jgi:hypothetical protein
MKKLDQNIIYSLAKQMQELRQFCSNPQSVEVFAGFADLVSAESKLEEFEKTEHYETIISISSLNELKEAINTAIATHLFEDYKDENGETKKRLRQSWDGLPGYAFSHIPTCIEKFEVVLTAELSSLAAYMVPKVGIYQTSDLVERADESLPAAILAALTDESRSDLRAAGRSLAFDLPDAAAFHIFRALESVLMEYFELLPDQDITLKNRNWGVCINKLEEIAKTDKEKGPAPHVIDGLRQIKDNYRNPLIHPDTSCSFDDALMLFDLAKSTIAQMVKDMARLKSQQEAPTLFDGTGQETE